MQQPSLSFFGFRGFASSKGVYEDEKLHALGGNFPKHKEFFNDMYYDQEESDPKYGSFGSNSAGSSTIGKDYIDPNSPFL
jgi:hypothetical protein